jgi:hypothetical protein
MTSANPRLTRSLNIRSTITPRKDEEQVDRPLRRTMLQISGFAAHISNAQGTARSTLLRIFRRGRGGEFLEARIIPERIEHWIEPEQRRSERHVLSQ